MEKKIINLTQHQILIQTKDGSVMIPKHGTVRCSTNRKIVDHIQINGFSIPINQTEFGAVAGLPEEREDTIIIVSGITANVLRNKRKDIYVIDEPIRDRSGRVIGCRSLSSAVTY